MSDMDKLRAAGLVPTVGEIIEQPVAGIGHNGAPEDTPPLTPFQRNEQAINDLYEEAKGWLDGEPIANHDQAAEVGKLRDMLRAAKKAADEDRKAEAKPHDDAKKAIQDKYNPLIKDKTGKADLAIQSCNDALKPFLKKIDDEQREEAKRLAVIANEKAAAALAVAKEAGQSANLETRETAEEMLKEAKGALGAAKAMDKAKPQVAGLKKAIGMKSVWVAEMTNPAAAIEHYRKERPADLKAWLRDQGAADARAGVRHIPGFTIREERVPT